MNKKSLFFVAASTLVVGGLLLTTSSKLNLFAANAADDNYVLTLDNTNTPTLTGTSGSLVLNDYVSLNYQNAAASSNGHVILNENGTITKTLNSYELLSVTATFTGDLGLRLGYNQEYNYHTELVSGESTTIEGNTFQFYTTAGADIESISLTYGCDLEAVDANTIVVGTTNTTVDRWNELYPNAQASVELNTESGRELTITLSGDTVLDNTGNNTIDGVLNLNNFDNVILTGEGTLSLTTANMIDGINANNLTVEEGATLNVTGASTTDKSAIKVLSELNILGTVNVSNFGYAVPLTKDGGEKGYSSLKINVQETGTFNITNVMHGFYAWSSALTTYIGIAGELNINVTGAGLYSEQTSSTLQFLGNSQTTITSGSNSIYGFKKVLVGDGSDGKTQNTASLNVCSTGANVIQSAIGNGSYVFNTTGKVYIHADSGNTKTGVQISKNTWDLLYIHCADMTIEGTDNAIGAWVSLDSGFAVDYNYETPNAKVTLLNCKSAIGGSTTGKSKLNTLFGIGGDVTANDVFNIVTN